MRSPRGSGRARSSGSGSAARARTWPKHVGPVRAAPAGVAPRRSARRLARPPSGGSTDLAVGDVARREHEGDDVLAVAADRAAAPAAPEVRAALGVRPRLDDRLVGLAAAALDGAEQHHPVGAGRERAHPALGGIRLTAVEGARADLLRDVGVGDVSRPTSPDPRSTPPRALYVRSPTPTGASSTGSGRMGRMPSTPDPRDLTLADFPVHRPVTTRWSDNDMYGHLNNAVYYELFDSAINGWQAEHVTDRPDDRRRRRASSPSRACAFYAEVAFPAPLVVGMRVVRLGTQQRHLPARPLRRPGARAARGPTPRSRPSATGSTSRSTPRPDDPPRSPTTCAPSWRRRWWRSRHDRRSRTARRDVGRVDGARRRRPRGARPTTTG